MGDKRKDYISWDEYFMGVALLSGMRSKDPGTQVGACIVSQDNKILSMGYNGFPKGCDDDDFPWARTAETPPAARRRSSPPSSPAPGATRRSARGWRPSPGRRTTPSTASGFAATPERTTKRPTTRW